MTYVMGGRSLCLTHNLQCQLSPYYLLTIFLWVTSILSSPQLFQTSSIPLTSPIQSPRAPPQQLLLPPSSRRKKSTSLGPPIPQPGLVPLLLPSNRVLISPLRCYSPSILPSQEPLLSNLYFTPDSSPPALNMLPHKPSQEVSICFLNAP